MENKKLVPVVDEWTEEIEDGNFVLDVIVWEFDGGGQWRSITGIRRKDDSKQGQSI